MSFPRCVYQITKITKYVLDVQSEHNPNHPNHTNIQAILDDFNAIHPKLWFTAEVERDNTLNYLDISIHRTPTNLKTSIYRKCTFTDTIIPYTSNHPTQHKYMAVKFLLNRLNCYHNMIRNLLMHKNPVPHNFSLLGAYRLTCPDCNKAYVGQT